MCSYRRRVGDAPNPKHKSVFVDFRVYIKLKKINHSQALVVDYLTAGLGGPITADPFAKQKNPLFTIKYLGILFSIQRHRTYQKVFFLA